MKVLEKTSNSILVYIPKQTIHGINCTQWMTLKEFITQF